MKSPRLLDTTLRDGSYVLDFQFSASDTAVLCAELERAGLELIEIGHGIGLGASERGGGRAAATDEEYMQAAAESLTRAAWGMFCIPGIARLEDVELAASYGMKFIRVGTNVGDAPLARPFVELAKKAGMFVAANYMKSYTMSPSEFAEMAVLSQQFGCDVLYVVDSAGGMLPNEVETYIRAVQDRCDIALGFHGHNNLGLAVGNSLRAVELGVDIIDTSLQGLGRSAGNTPTELFILVLERLGYRMGINPLEVMDVGERLVRSLVQKVGYDSIDAISGYSLFHSSYMGVIHEFASKYRVDPRRLIISLCEVDKLNAPRELVESIAQRIAGEGEEPFVARFRLDRFHGAEQSLPVERP